MHTLQIPLIKVDPQDTLPDLGYENLSIEDKFIFQSSVPVVFKLKKQDAPFIGAYYESAGLSYPARLSYSYSTGNLPPTDKVFAGIASMSLGTGFNVDEVEWYSLLPIELIRLK